MSTPASRVASTLVNERIFLQATGNDRASVLDWIEDAAEQHPLYVVLRERFESLTADNPTVQTEGQQMAYELARAGYDLGVQVGLHLRKPTDG